MKKIILLLSSLVFLIHFSAAQTTWNSATITSSSAGMVIPNQFSGLPNRTLQVEFQLSNDTLILIDSFAGNCTNNFLVYEYTAISNDSMEIRKADSGSVGYSCCKYTSGFSLPDSIYFYKNRVEVMQISSPNPINIYYEGLWYRVQRVNANSISYYPKYAMAAAIDSVTLGYNHNAPPFKDLFTIESGYIWFNYSFEAYDGSKHYFQISDKVNDSIFINSYLGTCNYVTLNFPGHYVSIPIMPCDSLTGPLYIHNIARPYEWTSAMPTVTHYQVQYAPAATVCNTSSGTLDYLQIALGLNDFTLQSIQNQNKVILNWRIELDADYTNFEVLKAKDKNYNFEVFGNIDRIKSKLDYNFTDLDFSSSSFYKIKAYHADGTFYESNTVFQRKSATENIIISPNPSTGISTIQGIDNTKYEIQLYTQDGRIILKKLISPNNNSYMIDLSSYPAGLYILKLNELETGNTIVQKLIKE